MKIPGHENIILEGKKHWISAVGTLIIPAFLVVLFTVFAVKISIYSPTTVFGESLKEALIILLSIVLIGAWSFGFNLWLNYYYDFYILTDKELVKVEQSGLFDRKIEEIPLIEVVSITAESKSFLEVFFSFGRLSLDNATPFPESFRFRYIVKPIDLAAKIIQVHNELVRQEKRGFELPEPGKNIGKQNLVAEISTKFSRHPTAAIQPPPPDLAEKKLQQETIKLRRKLTEALEESKKEEVGGKSVGEILSEEIISPPPKKEEKEEK